MSALVVLVIAVAWLGLDYAFSRQSGWRALAKRFPANSKPQGRRVRWHVVRLGPIPEAGCEAHDSVTPETVRLRWLALTSNLSGRPRTGADAER
jgi:hypothetical protein